MEFSRNFPTIMEGIGESVMHEYEIEQRQRLDIDDEEEQKLVGEWRALMKELKERTFEKLKIIQFPTENLLAMAVFQGATKGMIRKEDEDGMENNGTAGKEVGTKKAKGKAKQ